MRITYFTAASTALDGSSTRDVETACPASTSGARGARPGAGAREGSTMTDDTMTDDTLTAEVRGVVGELETAMRAGDAKAVVALYTPDAVRYDLAPPLRHLGPEVHDVAGLQAWFDGFGGSVGYEVRDLAVLAGEDVAVAYSLNKMYDPAPEGRFELWFRA